MLPTSKTNTTNNFIKTVIDTLKYKEGLYVTKNFQLLKMNFVDIESLNIITELNVLKRDTQQYRLLLYQHNGEFFANEERIGNRDSIPATTKFLKVIGTAKEDNSDLVVSPEYSCPIDVIKHILENKLSQPEQNKIWALGGESISLKELNQLNEFNNNEVFIHFENSILNTTKNFLDPLYYIFNGIHEGVAKLIVLIQFKTNHMGVWSGGHIEANNLIQGNNIYIIKNSNTSTRLVSFICSEAMNVPNDLSDDIKDTILWNDMPFLVLNPQINPDPSHQSFINFRRFILERDKKEVISLNWGKNSSYNGSRWYPNDKNTARSGIFFKTKESDLDYTNQKILGNHNKGMYFLHLNRNKYVYYLEGYLDLFRIENKPVDISNGVAAQQRREGPEIKNVFIFNEDIELVELTSVNDRHIEFLQERGVENLFLLNPENSIVEKERLINISTGKIIGKLETRWGEIINLHSFNLIESNECNCRMTYLDDNYNDSEQVRNLNCSNLIDFETILSDKSNYPNSIIDLRHQNIFLSYSKNASKYHYKYNLSNENAEIRKATLCYLGNVSTARVNSTYDELQQLFEDGTDGKRRIVVFYKRGNQLHAKFDEDAGSFTSPSNDNSSIF